VEVGLLSRKERVVPLYIILIFSYIAVDDLRTQDGESI
jgi:hypothetical protein